MADEIFHISVPAGIKAAQLKADSDPKFEGLRVKVVGGGCSGLQYKLGFDVEKEEDFIINFKNGENEVKIFIDAKSASFLSGSTLEFHDSLERSGFEVVNPNATGCCGCGKSFSG